METGEINISVCFSRRKLIFSKNLFSFVFKMAMSKVDLSKQIVILQNVFSKLLYFNMQYFQLGDFIFDWKTQTPKRNYFEDVDC